MQLTSMQLLTIALISVAQAGHIRKTGSMRITKLADLKLHVSEPDIVHDPNQPFGVLEEDKKFKFPWPYTIDDERCPTGYWRVGCVKDTQNAQKRWYHLAVPSEDQEPISVKVCGTWCKNVTGSQFFGVENGDKCYCTPYFHNTNSGGNGKCDMPCVGDNSQMCGGQYMTDVYEIHDCNNLPAVPCKVAPAMVPFAKTFKSRFYKGAEIPCKNGVDKYLSTVESACHIECQPGYELTHNDLQCIEKGNRLVYSWAQFTGKAECTPKICGPPPPGPHTRHPQQIVVFPNKVDYICQLGYSLNMTAEGLKEFDVFCTEEGTFSMLKPVSQ